MTSLPPASQIAASHPPTSRALRRRLVRQVILLFVVWPALILVPWIRVASGDDSFIPVAGMMSVVVVPTLLPLNIWAAVSVLRLRRRLNVHGWRLVECEVVPPGTHGWRLKEYQPSAPPETRVLAILRIRGRVLTASPFKRYVSPRLTHVWCAGPPEPGAVVSELGGARPFRVVRYKAPAG